MVGNNCRNSEMMMVSIICKFKFSLSKHDQHLHISHIGFLPFSFSCLLFPVTWELSFRLISIYEKYSGLPSWLTGKESACQCRSHRRCGLDPWVRKIPRRRKWQPTPTFLLGESQGQRSLAGYSPWGCNEWDMTE